MKKKFAYLLMGPGHNPARHIATFQGDAVISTLIGVPDMETACQKAEELAADGYGAIELCGAFGESGAREIIRRTGGGVAVGYAVHLPEQDPLFSTFFGGA